MRRVVAIVATPGLLAGIYIFVASFFGLTMDKLGSKAFLLHLGIFALAIPLIIIEKVERKGRIRSGKDYYRAKPRWVGMGSGILGLLALGMFFSFLALGHLASPEIINGEYVLNNHGTIVAHISDTY
jgi:hypothetical protein